ncbi:MAG: septum formation initiator family protein [Clostridiales Family XIII bacterium]|jgi:cell division protein FtsB|nr:septum formation initiator family protein [Clostridiales Family XIII bacterium]
MKKDESYTINIEEAQQARREKREHSAKCAKAALKARRRKVKASKAAAERARRSFVAGRRIVILCVSVACVFFVGTSAFRIMDLKGQQAKAADILESKTEQQARLESELAGLQDKEYIEEQARERLGMVKNGEVLYIFDESGYKSQ